MKTCLLFIILSFSLISFSQITSKKLFLSYAKDTVYVDETNTEINKLTHKKKLTSSLFASLRYENDTIVVQKLRASYVFGSLDDSKRDQLFKFLATRNKVDTTKVMIIHYTDTLKSIEEFPEKTGIVYNEDNTSHRHVINHKTFIKQHKSCIRKLSNKRKVKVYHFYKFNNGHPETYDKAVWYKDYQGLIDRLFRDYYSRYGSIIINPNGDFFCYNYVDGNSYLIKDIKKGKRWEKHKENYIRKIEKLNQYLLN